MIYKTKEAIEDAIEEIIERNEKGQKFSANFFIPMGSSHRGPSFAEIKDARVKGKQYMMDVRTNTNLPSLSVFITIEHIELVSYETEDRYLFIAKLKGCEQKVGLVINAVYPVTEVYGGK